MNTYFLNPKWAYYNDFGMDHVTLKTGVMAAEKLALPSNILWIENIFFFLRFLNAFKSPSGYNFVLNVIFFIIIND